MPEDQEKGDSVFDFLYSDTQRISLFLAQFHQFGQLTALTKSSQADHKNRSELGPGFMKTGTEETGSSKIEEKYDSVGLGPLTFLDEAGKRGLIVRSSDEARIGQLVLVTGSLKILDLGSIKGLWSIPGISDIMGRGDASEQSASPQGNRRDRRSGKAELAPSKPSNPMSGIILGFMSMLPHPIQGRLLTSSRQYWFSLKESGLLIDSTSLMIKHGIEIAGEWSIVGVIDAIAGDNSDDTDASSQVSEGEITPLFNMLEGSIVPMARKLMGRPPDFYGITPLLIFREVLA